MVFVVGIVVLGGFKADVAAGIQYGSVLGGGMAASEVDVACCLHRYVGTAQPAADGFVVLEAVLVGVLGAGEDAS